MIHISSNKNNILNKRKDIDMVKNIFVGFWSTDIYRSFNVSNHICYI